MTTESVLDGGSATAGKLANTAAVIAFVGYIGAVLYQGNPDKLAKELAQEARFLEFLAALAAVWFLATNSTTGRYAAPLVGLGVVAALMNFVGRAGVADALDAWTRGQVSAFDTLKKIFGGNAAT